MPVIVFQEVPPSVEYFPTIWFDELIHKTYRSDALDSRVIVGDLLVPLESRLSFDQLPVYLEWFAYPELLM
jgi:hypothetical protein